MLTFLGPIADSFRTNFIEEDRYLLILNGLKVTLVITVFAVLLGIVLGGLVRYEYYGREAEKRNPDSLRL